MIISKNQYLHGFGFLVILMALVRCVFPSVAGSLNQQGEMATECGEDSLGNDSVNLTLAKPVAHQQSMDKNVSLGIPDRKDMAKLNGKPLTLLRLQLLMVLLPALVKVKLQLPLKLDN